jgi:ketosteroid isomerase-like protein
MADQFTASHGLAAPAARPAAGDEETQSVIERFTQAWARPQLEHFMELLHPEVLLLQPVTRPIRGREAARTEFARLLQWLPDLRGTVDQSAVRGPLALIAWRLAFTLGRQPYELRIVDRIVVSDGLIREREAYYDSLRLMIAVIRRPRSWPGYWWYRGFLPR